MDSLNYQFSNPELLEEALTHPSCNLKNSQGNPFSYQRLEFLGDAVLGAVISALLIEHYPHEPEGDLAKRKSALVQKKAIAQLVRALGIHEHICFSETEKNHGGYDNSSVQEDVGEAIIGAIYADGGFAAAHRFIKTHWLPLLAAQEEVPMDAKTQLQEWSQAQSLGLPIYTVLNQTGAAHAPVFTVEVCVKPHAPQHAQAPTKRKAERLAAKKLLEAIAHD